MRVADLCTRRVIRAERSLPLVAAAELMRRHQVGALVIVEGDGERPVAMLTDRDIVVRCVADGKDPSQEIVRNCMTADVCACSEKDSLEEAARMMNDNAVSRLVVQTMDGEICGVLTFGRIIRSNDNERETSDVVQCATGKAAA